MTTEYYKGFELTVTITDILDRAMKEPIVKTRWFNCHAINGNKRVTISHSVSREAATSSMRHCIDETWGQGR